MDDLIIKKLSDIENLWQSEYADENNIDNFPPKHLLKYLILLYSTVLLPLRAHTSFQLAISSGFRCNEVNTAVGGSSNSYHRLGRAFDLVVLNEYQATEVYKWLVTDCPFHVEEFFYYPNKKIIHVAFTFNFQSNNSLIYKTR